MTKQKKNEEKSMIPIPEYVIYGDQNIPSDLKKVLDYFSDCGNQNYQVCLVGEKESVAKDLKKRGYQGKEFIHLTDKNVASIYAYLPLRVKTGIIRTNKLVSNPENNFNKVEQLGIHTLGLVPISEIELLNALGYGLSSWNGIYAYNSSNDCVCCFTQPTSCPLPCRCGP